MATGINQVNLSIVCLSETSTAAEPGKISGERSA